MVRPAATPRNLADQRPRLASTPSPGGRPFSGIFCWQANAQPGTPWARTARRGPRLSHDGRPVPGRHGPTLAPGWPPDVDLLLPGAVYGDRINAVDMRFAKVLRFGKTKTNVGLDVYNLFNSNTPTTYETVYDPATNGAKWMTPTAVLLSRFMRFNVQVDF